MTLVTEIRQCVQRQKNKSWPPICQNNVKGVYRPHDYRGSVGSRGLNIAVVKITFSKR
jgi:hypothetical protein